MIYIRNYPLLITIEDTGAMIEKLPLPNIKKLVDLTWDLEEQRRFYDEVERVMLCLIDAHPDLDKPNLKAEKKQYTRAKKILEHMNKRFGVSCYDDFWISGLPGVNGPIDFGGNK